MSEITNLTKKIDDFIKTVERKIGGYDEIIVACKDDRVDIRGKIEGKNGISTRVIRLETREKVRGGFFSGMLGIAGLIVSIIAMIVLLYAFTSGTKDRYKGVDAARDLGKMEKRLEFLESQNNYNNALGRRE